MSDSLQQYVVPPPSPVTNPDLKRQTETGSLTSFKVGQWLIDGAVIKAGDSISLNAGDKTISVGNISMDGTTSTINIGTILLDGSNSTIRTSDTGENVKISSAYISLRSGTTELGWLRSLNGTYGSVELKTDSINFYNGLSYMLGDSSGLTISTDSGSKAIFIQGQAGVYIGSGSELVVDQATGTVAISATATFVIPNKSGAYSGANYAGQIGYDYTNHRLYIGEGGTTWKSVLLS